MPTYNKNEKEAAKIIDFSVPSAWDASVEKMDGYLLFSIYGYRNILYGRNLIAEVIFDEENHFLLVQKTNDFHIKLTLVQRILHYLRRNSLDLNVYQI